MKQSKFDRKSVIEIKYLGIGTEFLEVAILTG